MSNKTIKISFMSGKGGVGKSLILANISRVFAEKFSTVLIWDNNFQFPIQHFLNGVVPNIRLFDVLQYNLSIEKAIVKVSDRIFLVGGSNDYIPFTENFQKALNAFLNLIQINDFDIAFLDNSSGFHPFFVNISKKTDLNIIFLTEEPTSVFDSYGLVKILYKIYGIDNIALVVNNVVDEEDGVEVFNKFNLVTKNFLGVQFPLVGIVPYEKKLKPTFLNQEILLDQIKEGDFYNSLKKLTENILNLCNKRNILNK